jgi:hypothetical protein
MTYQIERDTSPKKSGFVQSIWDVGMILSLVILALSVQNGNFNRTNSTSPLRPVDTSEIINNPREFMGKSITIRSKPIRQVALNSFTVREGDFSQKDPMLVVNASGVPFNFPSDRNLDVQVIGEVRDFSIPEIERDYNLRLNPQQYSGYVNKPVIVAQSISLAPTPGQVSQNPRQYYGKAITVAGRVKNIQSPVLMTLDKGQLFGGGDLPVLLTSSAKIAINEGQNVAIVGEVRPFIASEIQNRYNLTWDAGVQQQLEKQYGNKPILVADAIYP